MGIFWGVHNEDYSVLGSILGSPYFGKLPFTNHLASSQKNGGWGHHSGGGEGGRTVVSGSVQVGSMGSYRSRLGHV